MIFWMIERVRSSLCGIFAIRWIEGLFLRVGVLGVFGAFGTYGVDGTAADDAGEVGAGAATAAGPDPSAYEVSMSAMNAFPPIVSEGEARNERRPKCIDSNIEEIVVTMSEEGAASASALVVGMAFLKKSE